MPGQIPSKSLAAYAKERGVLICGVHGHHGTFVDTEQAKDDSSDTSGVFDPSSMFGGGGRRGFTIFVTGGASSYFGAEGPGEGEFGGSNGDLV